MGARLLAFCIWGVVAASAVYWGLLFSSRPMAAPAYALPVALAGAPAQADLSRVLGREAEVATPVEAAAAPGASRFQLLGVVAPKVPGQELGWALIGVDGKPAKAYRQGAVIDGDVVLQNVKHRSAGLGPAGQAVQFQLEIPPLAPAARGTPTAAQAPLPPGAVAGAVPGMAPGATQFSRPVTGPAGANMLPPTARPVRPVDVQNNTQPVPPEAQMPDPTPINMAPPPGSGAPMR